MPGIPLEAQGMRLPVLRETRMPAVLVRDRTVQHVIDVTPGVAAAVVAALESWADAPFIWREAKRLRRRPPEPGSPLNDASRAPTRVAPSWRAAIDSLRCPPALTFVR